MNKYEALNRMTLCRDSRGYYVVYKESKEVKLEVMLGPEDNRPHIAIAEDICLAVEMAQENGVSLYQMLTQLGYVVSRRYDGGYHPRHDYPPRHDDGSWQYDAVLSRARCR